VAALGSRHDELVDIRRATMGIDAIYAAEGLQVVTGQSASPGVPCMPKAACRGAGVQRLSCSGVCMRLALLAVLGSWLRCISGMNSTCNCKCLAGSCMLLSEPLFAMLRADASANVAAT